MIGWIRSWQAQNEQRNDAVTYCKGQQQTSANNNNNNDDDDDDDDDDDNKKGEITKIAVGLLLVPFLIPGLPTRSPSSIQISLQS